MEVIVRETSPLASVQLVHYVGPLPDRDLVVEARVLGFTVIVKKDDFFRNSLLPCPCIFFEPDAILDKDDPQLLFLKSRKWRISTMKLGQVYSQGLALPVGMVQHYGLDPGSLVEKQDITLELRVSKYISPAERDQYCHSQHTSRSAFPLERVPKTNEPSLQSDPNILTRLLQSRRSVVVTEKIDGCSMTIWAGGIASRNLSLVGPPDKSTQHYFDVEQRYQLQAQLQEKFPDLCIQGEVTHPMVQQNRLGVHRAELQVFNIYDSKTHTYLPWSEVKRICNELHLHTVPELFVDVTLQELGWDSVQTMLAFVHDRNYATGKPSEGMVVKTNDGQRPRISFKVVSRRYLANV
jgi:RNA ligase (TIGR02306 family)